MASPKETSEGSGWRWRAPNNRRALGRYASAQFRHLWWICRDPGERPVRSSSGTYEVEPTSPGRLSSHGRPLPRLPLAARHPSQSPSSGRPPSRRGRRGDLRLEPNLEEDHTVEVQETMKRMEFRQIRCIEEK